jgi:hypothetical protein
MAEEAIREGQVLIGPLFSEPMQVETVKPTGAETWTLGLVGSATPQFRRVTLTAREMNLQADLLLWAWVGQNHTDIFLLT